MTLTLNDTIEFLKVILKESCFVCIVLIISLIVVCLASLIPSFNTIKTHRIPFALSSFSCSFYENLDKNIKKFLVLPLSFCLLSLLFLPSEGVKSAIGATFSCFKEHFSPPISAKN